MPYKDREKRLAYLRKYRKTYEKENAATISAKRKARYAAHPEIRKAAADSHRRSMRRKRRQLTDLLGAKCNRCGIADERTFNIHHTYHDGKADRITSNGKKRGYTAGYYNRLIERAKKDKNALELICANCHAIEHWVEDN